MKISILIPAHNEELMVANCIQSCLNQTRTADQIVIVNDGSTDKTGDVLASFGDKIEVLTIPEATGNKSKAQEQGLKLITGDIVIMSDADTIIDKNFIAEVLKDFQNDEIAAVAGHVRSVRHNWLTACRAIEYVIAQNIHKVAQYYIGYIFVLPGAAVAFRTEILKKIPFTHSTICEDLDLTYILHEQGNRLSYNRDAVVYTADPSTLRNYIGQIRRWHTGGAECLKNHWRILFQNPRASLELSLSYISTFVSAFLLFIVPIISLKFFLTFLVAPILIFSLTCSVIAALIEKRPFLMLCSIPFIAIILINNYIIVESVLKVFLITERDIVWYSPKRYKYKSSMIKFDVVSNKEMA